MASETSGLIVCLGYAGTILVVLAYLPQIIHLVVERCSAGLSIKAYECWIIAAALLLTYAVTTRDIVFIALQGYQLIALSLICFFGKRFERSPCEEHQ